MIKEWTDLGYGRFYNFSEASRGILHGQRIEFGDASHTDFEVGYGTRKNLARNECVALLLVLSGTHADVVCAAEQRTSPPSVSPSSCVANPFLSATSSSLLFATPSENLLF